jgi:hypothetical protein
MRLRLVTQRKMHGGGQSQLLLRLLKRHRLLVIVLAHLPSLATQNLSNFG